MTTCIQRLAFLSCLHAWGTMLSAFALSSDLLFIFSLPCLFIQYNISYILCLPHLVPATYPGQLGDAGDHTLVYICYFYEKVHEVR